MSISLSYLYTPSVKSKKKLPAKYFTALCMLGNKHIYSWSLFLPLCLNGCVIKPYEGIQEKLEKERRTTISFICPANLFLLIDFPQVSCSL